MTSLAAETAGSGGIQWIQALRNGVGVQKVLFALKIAARSNGAFPGTVRPGEHGQDRHRSGGRANFANDLVVAFVQIVRDEANLEFSAAGHFHDVQVRFQVEDGDARPERFQPRLVTCGYDTVFEFFRKRVVMDHNFFSLV